MARPHVVSDGIEAGYKAMAANEEREKEALAWSELTMTDIAHDEE